jgi:hypothetical protein
MILYYETKKHRKGFVIIDGKSSVYILLTKEKFMNFYKIYNYRNKNVLQYIKTWINYNYPLTRAKLRDTNEKFMNFYKIIIVTKINFKIYKSSDKLQLSSNNSKVKRCTMWKFELRNERKLMVIKYKKFNY